MSAALHAVPSRADRIPPNNLEAEMALLGAIIADPKGETLDAIAGIVDAADFYAHIHESIFAAIVALQQRAEPADLVGVAAELRRRQQLDRVGGVAYLTQLIDAVQTID